MPGAAQRTRKPLPTTRKSWERELRGVQKLLERLDVSVVDLGEVWAERMRVYYNLRLQDLVDNEPIQRNTRSGVGDRRIAVVDGGRVPKQSK